MEKAKVCAHSRWSMQLGKDRVQNLTQSSYIVQTDSPQSHPRALFCSNWLIFFSPKKRRQVRSEATTSLQYVHSHPLGLLHPDVVQLNTHSWQTGIDAGI